MKQATDSREFKVIMLGDSNVGKTSIIKRFSANNFDQDVEPTVGASYMTKEMNVDGNKIIMNIWDTAGQERYQSLIANYSRNAHAAVLVYDTTNSESFTNIDRWRDELNKFSSPNLLIFLVANKIDLEASVEDIEAIRWTKQNRATFQQTSAATGRGINDLFNAVARQLNEKAEELEKGNSFQKRNLKEEPKKQGSCCRA